MGVAPLESVAVDEVLKLLSNSGLAVMPGVESLELTEVVLKLKGSGGRFAPVGESVASVIADEVLRLFDKLGFLNEVKELASVVVEEVLKLSSKNGLANILGVSALVLTEVVLKFEGSGRRFGPDGVSVASVIADEVLRLIDKPGFAKFASVVEELALLNSDGRKGNRSKLICDKDIAL